VTYATTCRHTHVREHCLRQRTRRQLAPRTEIVHQLNIDITRSPVRLCTQNPTERNSQCPGVEFPVSASARGFGTQLSELRFIGSGLIVAARTMEAAGGEHCDRPRREDHPQRGLLLARAGLQRRGAGGGVGDVGEPGPRALDLRGLGKRRLRVGGVGTPRDRVVWAEGPEPGSHKGHGAMATVIRDWPRSITVLRSIYRLQPMDFGLAGSPPHGGDQTRPLDKRRDISVGLLASGPHHRLTELGERLD
jgi:hypothetical protein